MNTGQTVFSQLVDHLPIHKFRQCVRRFPGNRGIRRFSCWDQFLCLAFAQLTFRESLRDIVTCRRSLGATRDHAGIRGHVSRSTLADANATRDWRSDADFAAVLIRTARQLYLKDSFGVALKETVYAFDSTTVDLGLSLFPWAQFRRHQSAVKLHTLIALRGNIPCFVHVSSGRLGDVTALDHRPIESGACYVMDSAYLAFRRLHRFTAGLAFFLMRARRDLDFGRRAHRDVDRSTGLRSDQTIVLCGPKTCGLYPAALRRISYYAADLDRRLVFLTNNCGLAARTITQLYKCRWQVELFFKWIKHYLRIQAFYGTSINAVRTQVWIALSVYVLAAIVRKRLGSDRSLGEILQILSIGLFEKTPLFQVFSQRPAQIGNDGDHNQLSLFDF